MTDGISAVPAFDRDAFIAGLRGDQDGRSTFAEFMAATWLAGIGSYQVDLMRRTCTYHAPRWADLRRGLSGGRAGSRVRALITSAPRASAPKAVASVGTVRM